MKTKTITLTSAQVVTIRRIGPAASAHVERMQPELPTAIARFGIKNAKDVETKTLSDLAHEGNEALLGPLLEWMSQSSEARTQARIFRVCACTIEPKLTPETIDDVLDSDEFIELERHIDEFEKEGAVNLLPFSKTRSA